MATMKWSPELVSLAENNVMQCEVKHDGCAASGYRVTGQNVALTSYSGTYSGQSDKQLVNGTLQSWWNEYQLYKGQAMSSDHPKYVAPVAVG